jgi:Mor family transcriptional regulator
MAKSGSDFLRDVETLLNGALGHPAGTLALKEILSRHGGSDVYIPMSSELYALWRKKWIRKNFTGANHQELAYTCDLSESQVRRILNEEEPPPLGEP